MRSVMSSQQHFAQVPEAEIQRSSFNRSHGLKTTFDAGYLIPIYFDEALPGDTFNLNLSAFARLATPIKPIMDNMFMDVFFFAVPNRLLWSNWERFNGAQDDPADSTDFIIPQITLGAVQATNSLSDYFGIPPGMVNNMNVNAFHFRAYNLIWNTHFRDQNLQNSAVVDLDDGPDASADYVLRKRGKRHDYFTSCLPWLQKGTAIPLVGDQMFITTDTVENLSGIRPSMKLRRADTGAQPAASGALCVHPTGANGGMDYSATAVTGGANGAGLYPSNLIGDFTATNIATINSLRQAFQLQRLYERDARGGTRYTEILRAHFGVISPDARLQRPEYLGGGSVPVNINPVAQTSITGTTPQGNLSAFGTVTHLGSGFTKSFVEHCVLIGLVSVRADLTYQQGLDRMWRRSTRFDFYWPALSHIGEQAVLNSEIYVKSLAADTDVFGYQERYAEYRYKPSLVTSLFRSDVTAGFTSLDYWHLSQEFGSLPTLNSTFIEDSPPVDRVIATATEPHFLYDSYIKLICARPMPVYGVPGMIDHF